MRPILMTLAAICMASLTLGVAQAQMGVGYANVERIIAESPQGRALAARIDAEQDKWREQIEVKALEIRQSQKDAQARAPGLNDAARRELQQDIEGQMAELRRLEDDAQRALAKMRDDELRKIEKIVLPAIEAVRKEALLAVVLRQDNLLAADPSRDLTDAVIAKMAASQ